MKGYLTTVNRFSILVSCSSIFKDSSCINNNFLTVFSLLTSKAMKIAVMCLVHCFICSLGKEALCGHSVYTFWIKLCWVFITYVWISLMTQREKKTQNPKPRLPETGKISSENKSGRLRQTPKLGDNKESFLLLPSTLSLCLFSEEGGGRGAGGGECKGRKSFPLKQHDPKIDWVTVCPLQ